MRPGTALLVLVALVSCSSRVAAPPTDGGQVPSRGPWLLGPEADSDLVHADDTEASLRERFGASAVRADSVHVGEGIFERGTILFPDDSTRRLDIVWEDTVARARPAYVYVSGSAAVWRLYPGVGIGTDLKTLEALNGRSFLLSGFAWDYGGTTAGFQRGRLDTLWSRDVDLGGAALLRLDPPPQRPQDTLLAHVLGDRVFSSDHPAMRALNPRVYQILVRPR